MCEALWVTEGISATEVWSVTLVNRLPNTDIKQMAQVSDLRLKWGCSKCLKMVQELRCVS